MGSRNSCRRVLVAGRSHRETSQWQSQHHPFDPFIFDDGFVDNVEFDFNDRKKIVHVKSAFRVGIYDLGANRRRIEKIRKLFEERNTVATMTKNTYFIVKDQQGDDYLCPLNSVRDKGALTDDELDNCVEKDIVERYSGNIDIESI